MRDIETENHIENMLDIDELDNRRSKKKPTKKDSRVGASLGGVPNILEDEPPEPNKIYLGLRVPENILDTLDDLASKSSKAANTKKIKLNPYCVKILTLFAEGKLVYKK